MAYMNKTRALPLGQTVNSNGWLGALGAAFSRRAVFNRTVRELSALSARELADLGIERSMITRVANEAAYGEAARAK